MPLIKVPGLTEDNIEEMQGNCNSVQKEDTNESTILGSIIKKINNIF